MLKYLKGLAKQQGMIPGELQVELLHFKPGDMMLPDAFGMGYKWGSDDGIIIKFPDTETEIAFYKWKMWGVEPDASGRD